MKHKDKELTRKERQCFNRRHNYEANITSIDLCVKKHGNHIHQKTIRTIYQENMIKHLYHGGF